MIIPVQIEFKDNFMIIKHKGDNTVQQINLFEKDTGVIISNPQFDIPAYVLHLKQFGTSLICGHIIENLIGYLKKTDLEEILLIIDFDEIVEISTSFSEEYTRFLLSTKSKVLSINQNTNISNTLSEYILSIIDIQDVTE